MKNRKSFRGCWLGLLLAVCGLSVAQPSKGWVHFDWHGETIFGKYYPKVAISVPLTLEDLPYPFCLQFDMGATRTMVYANAFGSFALRHPQVLQKRDSNGEPYYLNGRRCDVLRGVSVRLDHTDFGPRDLVWATDYGDPIPADSLTTASPKLIGTLAPDLFAGKILVIDFAENRMAAFDALPKQYTKATFVDAQIRKGRIKIPLSFGNTQHYVMFDTGNCLADLLLDKQTIDAVTNPADTPQEALNGNTWGQAIVYYSKALQAPVTLNGQPLRLERAHYSDLDMDVQFNKEEKIIGLIGPLLFDGQVVIIDYPHNRFGVWQKK